MKDILVALVIAVMIVLICFGCYNLFKENAECMDRGGAYVRTFMGYACVGGR
jgi:uncharacterized protein YxeA